MKIVIHLSVSAPFESMYIGGTNPLLLKGKINVELTPEILLDLVFGCFKPSVAGITYSKITKCSIQDGIWTGEAGCHLPATDTKESVETLVKMGFTLDVEAAKHYPKLGLLD